MACAEGKNIVEFTPDAYVREVYIEQSSTPCVLPPEPPLPPPPPAPPPPIIPDPEPEPDPEPDPEYPYPDWDAENVGGDPVADGPCEGFQFVMASNYVYGILPDVDPNSVIPTSWIDCHKQLLESEVLGTFGASAVRNGPYKWVAVSTPALKRSANVKIGAGDCDALSGLNDSPTFGTYVTLAAPYCLN
jgi:hypothetical protein